MPTLKSFNYDSRMIKDAILQQQQRIMPTLYGKCDNY